ncbi:hypothetical protein MTO96_050479 [Rhipicephalus appendiculatus]
MGKTGASEAELWSRTEPHQHRRLYMALEESGLLEKAMKSQFSRKPTSSHVPFDVPFTDYAIVYAIGCSLSTLVFCIEVFLHSRAQPTTTTARQQK